MGKKTLMCGVEIRVKIPARASVEANSMFWIGNTNPYRRILSIHKQVFACGRSSTSAENNLRKRTSLATQKSAVKGIRCYCQCTRSCCQVYRIDGNTYLM